MIFYGNIVDPLWLCHVPMLMSSVNSSLVNKGLCSWIHVVSLIYLFFSGPCRVGVQSCHDECCICQMVILLLLLSIQWQFVSLVDIQLNLSLWITWFLQFSSHALLCNTTSKFLHICLFSPAPLPSFLLCKRVSCSTPEI